MNNLIIPGYTFTIDGEGNKFLTYPNGVKAEVNLKLYVNQNKLDELRFEIEDYSNGKVFLGTFTVNGIYEGEYPK